MEPRILGTDEHGHADPTRGPRTESGPSPAKPTGWRRMTPGLYAGQQSANAWDGLPPGVTHWELLTALDRAAAALPIPRPEIDTLRILWTWTRAEDWRRDSRPLVWPSNDLLMDVLGLTLSGLRRRLRGLAERGLIGFRDSPNGRRYGHRDNAGRIVLETTYGIDLSPAAALYDVALDAAEAHAGDRRERASLKRRRTRARRALLQVLETARDHGHARTLDAPRLARAGELALMTLPTAALPALAEAVESLEALVAAAEARLAEALGVDAAGKEDRDAESTASSVKNEPLGSTGGALIQDTTEHPLPNGRYCNEARQRDRSAVQGPAGSEKSDSRKGGLRKMEAPKPKGSGDRAAEKPPSPGSASGNARSGRHSATYDHGLAYTPLKNVLAVLPSDIRDWLPPGQRPSWANLVDLMHMHLGPLGVSSQAWTMACTELGRYGAAVAVAIVAAKRDGIDKPDRYLRSMAYRAQQGELRLHQSVWGILQARREARARTGREGRADGRG